MNGKPIPIGTEFTTVVLSDFFMELFFPHGVSAYGFKFQAGMAVSMSSTYSIVNRFFTIGVEIAVRS